MLPRYRPPHYIGLVSTTVVLLVGSCGQSSDNSYQLRRVRLKCDCTRAETRFRLSTKRTSPFKSAGGPQFSRLLASRGLRISGSNAGYTMFRGSVKGTGYPLHSPVSPSLPLPCVTVCHHISTGVYQVAEGQGV